MTLLLMMVLTVTDEVAFRMVPPAECFAHVARLRAGERVTVEAPDGRVVDVEQVRCILPLREKTEMPAS